MSGKLALFVIQDHKEAFGKKKFVFLQWKYITGKTLGREDIFCFLVSGSFSHCANAVQCRTVDNGRVLMGPYTMVVLEAGD